MKNYKEQNEAEYQERYHLIKFASKDEAAAFESKRRELTSALDGQILWGHGGTKADCTSLSRGCRLCGEGTWSCLFINGRCNCKCFYCPAPQDEDCLPTTNAVSFASPAEYTAYLREFGFKGVSISGGEPLLTPELTLSYIRAVREELPETYIWMYTNGSLVTADILNKLRDAGLDEIRFDIGATNYDINNLRLAQGVIPVITVEIPAVPEELETLKNILPELASSGVTNLNLHQLRLTPYNFDHLIKRGYTYISNEKVTVIESELTALEIIKHVKETGVGINVNYCSFPYKNRYQGLAARKRSAGYMVKSFEEITDGGYIRTLSLTGEPDRVLKLAESTAGELYELSRDKTKITIHPSAIKTADTEDLQRSVYYSSARQLQSVSYRNPFRQIKLTESKNVVIERFRVSEEYTENDDTYERLETGLLPY